MAKSSKQSSGSAKLPSNSYHSVPVSSKQISTSSPALKSLTKPPVSSPVVSKSSASLKTPTLDSKTMRLKDEDSKDFESSSNSNAEARIFTLKTGIQKDQPIIIMSSEFIPLNGTPQDKVLSLKETSKGIIDKTARAILSQEPAVKEYVDGISLGMTKMVDSEDDFLRTLTSVVRDTLGALDITSFALPRAKNSDHIGSLYEILLKSGFSAKDVVEFTETKVWMQALVELKRLLLCHSPDLVMQKFATSSANSDSKKRGRLPFQIENVTNPSDNLKRLWINPYYTKLPNQAQITSKSTIDSAAAMLLDFQKNQYIDLSNANAPVKMPTASGAKGASGISADQKNAKPLGSPVLSSFVESGRDISIIANCLFKELEYSFQINNNGGNNFFAKGITARYGYTFSPTGDNFQMWDYIVGRFPESVLDFSDEPTGLGNSLVSFAQRTVKISNQVPFRVLTFENNYLEGSNSTPGSYYYIDSSLNSTDGKNFDLYRLEYLIDRTQDGIGTTDEIITLLGYKIVPANSAIEGLTERFEKRAAALSHPQSSLRGVLEYLTQVTKFYEKVVLVDDVGTKPADSDGERANNDDPGRLFRGIDTSNKANLSEEDNVGIRLAALICKLAVNPTSSYKSKSDGIRTTLFMLFMNLIMKQADKVTNSETITALKSRLAQLVFGTNSSKIINEDEMKKVVDEGRAFASSVSYLDAKNATYAETDLIFEDSYTGSSFTDVYDPGKQKDLPPEYAAMWSNHVESRYFDIEKMLNTGLWGSVISLMRGIYTHPSLFQNGVNTGYSGMQKMSYMYSYFDMLMRIIASQCPENILSSYRYKYDIVEKKTMSIGETSTIAQVNLLTVEETGIMVDKVSGFSLNEYFDIRANKKTGFVFQTRPVPLKCTRTQSALSYLEEEESHTLRQVAIFRKYLQVLVSKLNTFKNFLKNDFSKITNRLNTLLATEPGVSGDEDLKKSIINTSFGEEQTTLTRYILSEYRDKCVTKDTISKLKPLPSFPDRPKDNYPNFFSVNETDHVSYSALRSFFDAPEFLKDSGFNKKILSVGIPPGMMRRLNGSVRLSADNISGHRQRIVRMNVYKMDRLHPDIVYLPRQYLFDMSRFPTRVLGNWHKETLSKKIVDLRALPMKVMHPDGRISREKDITEAFRPGDYGTFLDDEEKSQIYTNHSISFICEEYLRWFTDCRFEETRYFNFGPIESSNGAKVLTDAEIQYTNFVNILKSKKIKEYPRDPGAPVYAQEVPANAQSADVNYTLTLGNTTYEFAWSGKDPFAKVSEKKFKIPVDSTMMSYFENETLFLSESREVTKKIFLPKKFDRVFNVLVDPDDFYVDESMTEPSVIEKFKQMGGLTGGDLDNNPSTTLYKHRERSPDDISLDEYFVTIEPFDYVDQQEV